MHQILKDSTQKERLHAATVGEGQAAGSTYSTQGVGLPLPCFASGHEIHRARSKLVPREDSTEDNAALPPPWYLAPSRLGRVVGHSPYVCAIF